MNPCSLSKAYCHAVAIIIVCPLRSRNGRRGTGVGVEWIELAQDRDKWLALVNTVMNLRVPQNAGKFLTSPGTVSFSERN
jgi:hypothetical protein